MLEIVTQAEAARLMNTSSAAIKHLIDNGYLAGEKQGKSVLIKLEALKTLLGSQALNDIQRKALENAFPDAAASKKYANFVPTWQQAVPEASPLPEQAKITIRQENAKVKTVEEGVATLWQQFLDGDLILDPDFQREFVWDRKKSSLFIDSLVSGYPTQSLYFSREADNRRIVIDGRQRLTALFNYLSKVWSPDGSVFRLSRDLDDSRLRGRAFDQLDGVTARAIMGASLAVSTVDEPLRPDIKRIIFMRLNDKPTPLDPQQFRNALYYGPFMHFVRDLTKFEKFRELAHPSRKTKESQYQEMILRFLALDTHDVNSFRGSLRDLLDATCQTYQHEKQQEIYDTMRGRFQEAVLRNEVLFGDQTFTRFNLGKRLVNPNGFWTSKFINKNIYELMMWGVLRIQEEEFLLYRDSLRESILHFFATNQMIKIHLEGGHSNGKNAAVKERFALFQARLNATLQQMREVNEPFTYEWKWSQFHLTDRCAVCDKPILERDDSAVYEHSDYWAERPKEKVNFAHRCCVNY